MLHDYREYLDAAVASEMLAPDEAECMFPISADDDIADFYEWLKRWKVKAC